jgi:hypothetical protein
MAILVSLVHSVAMIVAGGFLAWLVYRYLGLKFVSRSCFNLDATWAFSLVLVGALSLTMTLASHADKTPLPVKLPLPLHHRTRRASGLIAKLRMMSASLS